MIKSNTPATHREMKMMEMVMIGFIHGYFNTGANKCPCQ